MMRENGVWPIRNRITRWRKRVDQRPTFHYFPEDDEEEQVSGGLDHWVHRNAGGPQWTWRKTPSWSIRERRRT